MTSKYMNKNGEKKLLASIMMAAIMIAGAFCIIQSSDESDAAESITYTDISGADFLKLSKNGTIVVDKNYKLTSSVNITDDLTIDLNGKAISTGSLEAGTKYPVFNITELNNHTLTMKDSSSDKTGKIDNTGAGTSIFNSYGVVKAGNLVIESGTYVTDYCIILYSPTNGTADVSLEITGGKFIGNAIWFGNNGIKNATISNATFECENDISLYLGSNVNTTIDKCKITNKGNTAVEIKAGNVLIKNSTITSDTFNYGKGDINHNGSGDSVATIAINNGYCGSSGTTEVNVTIQNSTVTNTVQPSTPVIAATDVAEKVTQPVKVTWEGHSSNVYIVKGQENVPVMINGGSEISGTKDTDMSDQIDAVFTAGADEVELKTGIIPADYDVPTGKSLVLSKDVTVEGKIVLEGEGSKVTLPLDNSTQVIGSATDYVTFTDFTGNVSVSYGSVVINGTINGGTITATGDMKISGVIDADTIIVVDSTSTLTFIDTTTINPGVKVTINYTSSVNTTPLVTGNLYLYGNLVSSAGVDIFVANGATFKAFSGSTIQQTISVKPAAGSTTSKIDLGDAMSTITINDDLSSSNTYSQTQTVIIADTLILKSGTVTTILGKLIVNEGVTLVIENGAKLSIGAAGMNTAEVVVNGKIEVESGAKFEVLGAKEVSVSGNIVSDGKITINSIVKIKENGKILVDDGTGSEITVTDGLTIENGGALEIRGEFTINSISNKGTITLNGAVLKEASVINMAADGATIAIISFTSATGSQGLTVNDQDLVFEKVDGVNVKALKYNTITLTNSTANVGIKGLTISESVTIKTVSGQKQYYNDFVISGSLSIADETPEGDVESYTVALKVTGTATENFSCSIKVTDSLTLGKGVEMTVDGVLDVTGKLTAIAADSGITSSGAINVSGMIETIKQIVNNINAFSYDTLVDSVPHYYYTTLKTAIDNGATTITSMGTVSIIDDITIPSGVVLKSVSPATGTITIGSTDSRNVTVTVKDGGQIRNCTIDVLGTLVFENKKDSRSNVITSDVSVIGDVSLKYTNIYTALDTASENDVITITRNTAVTLDKDISIKENVTLDIPSGKAVVANDGVTVTVNGTLKASGTISAETVFAKKASEETGSEASAIVVNGIFMSLDPVSYADYAIAGAYFNLVNSIGNYNYVTPVATAATMAADVTGGIIDVYGDNKVSDISFTGTETQTITVTIKSGASLSAGKITISYATVNVQGQFDGSISASAGEVKVVNSKTFVVRTFVDETEKIAVTGAPVKADAEGFKPTMTIVSGEVTVNGTLNVSNLNKFVISEGASVIVSGSGSTITASDLTVDGALTAYNGGKITATNLNVIGTFTVSKADSTLGTTNGIADVATVYLGGSKSDVRLTTGAAATLVGEFSPSNMLYVFAGAVVSDEIQTILDSKDSIAYYVEGELWMTVYNFGSATNVEVKKIPVENVKFDGWVYKTDAPATTINFSGNKTVEAKIIYEVYKIKFNVCAGIDNVYIDGILAGSNATVAAGEHTISYTLSNGYSGTATMLVNGEKVTGYKFTASGAYTNVVNDVDYTIILQGIEKSGYVPESPDAPAEGKDDSMGITEYLLIVLVVLAAILVVVVAIRMMRS